MRLASSASLFRRLGAPSQQQLHQVAQSSSRCWLLSSSASATATTSAAALVSSHRQISSSFGRITDEDRRWWLIHLECAPDVNAGTFVSWLDNCGTHTTKKLIERNVWTIEQVANLSSDQIDELRYKEGCVNMDVVWEHARTVLVPLRNRAEGSSAATSSLHDRILELRKKRELEKRRGEILSERSGTVATRGETLARLREQVEKKRQALREQQQRRQQQEQQKQDGEEEEEEEDDDDGEEEQAEEKDPSKIVDELGKPPVK